MVRVDGRAVWYLRRGLLFLTPGKGKLQHRWFCPSRAASKGHCAVCILASGPVGTHSPYTKIQQAPPVICPYPVQAASTWLRLVVGKALCKTGHNQAATKTSLDAARAITRRAWQRQHVRNAKTCRLWPCGSSRPEYRQEVAADGQRFFSVHPPEREAQVYMSFQ